MLTLIQRKVCLMTRYLALPVLLYFVNKSWHGIIVIQNNNKKVHIHKIGI